MSEKAVLLASRLAEILHKLNSGQTISVKELAIEFGVSERTIQKDLNERLDPSIIDSLGNGLYRLVPGFLGNLTMEDIREFSEVSGIVDLYPDLDDVIRHRIRDTLIVKSRVNKGCIPASNNFKEINYTILNCIKLRFEYNNKNIVSEPYKLLNHNGIWYLLCKVGNVVKSYCVHKMKKVRRDIVNFSKDDNLLKLIEKNPSPWFREEQVEVVISVSSDFSDYFLDRNILPDRERTIKEEDGSLTVILKVNSIDEVKGIIKFWIPNIAVIKPANLKESIIKDIKKYL